MKQPSLSDNLKHMIAILSDKEYHSGTDIGNSLQISRAAVWKLIKQLTALGISIESVTNRGYKLAHDLEFLSKEKIQEHICAQRFSFLDKIFIFDAIPSTNDHLVSYSKQHLASNAVCFSECQTAGRGRLGRTWVSPILSNVYMSLLWNFNVDMTGLAGLHILSALAAVHALEKVTKIPDLQLKWPNDIMWNGQKLGGILIDITGESNGTCSAVIGIGLNIQMAKNAVNKIDKPWTALNQITAKSVSRNLIAGTLLDYLIAYLMKFSKTGISSFIEEWEAKDCLTNKGISVTSGNKTLTGVAKGIDDHGRLLLETRVNTILALNAGDVTLHL